MSKNWRWDIFTAVFCLRSLFKIEPNSITLHGKNSENKLQEPVTKPLSNSKDLESTMHSTQMTKISPAQVIK